MCSPIFIDGKEVCLYAWVLIEVTSEPLYPDKQRFFKKNPPKKKKKKAPEQAGS